MTIKQFLANLRKSHPGLNFKEIEMACFFAQKSYKNIKRLSGQSRLDHCFDVALELAKMKLDTTTITAAILHEVLDKETISLKELEKKFGRDTAFLIESLTNVSQIKAQRTKKNASTFRKLFLAMAKDIRVVLIKLANQLHNLKTLYIFDKEDQKRIAAQILDIYAPLAERLGIGELKGRLEDAAFSYAYPKKYKKIVKLVKEKREKREAYVRKIIPLVKKILKKEKVRFTGIQARTKHYYGIYKKLVKYDYNWSKIDDLIGLRIIVSNVKNCYGALGAIHNQWKPLIKHFNDYIATPKSNGYRSLHTAVICEEGRPVEFQIRTKEMHEQAEHGIAAHWHYGEQGKKSIVPNKKLQKELTWVKQLRQWQEQTDISEKEFFDSLKIDFLNDRIFAFTPKGDVVDLPEEATALDFAYYVHTELGHKCTGAKIDGKFSAVSTPLRNGQMVEIITEKNKKPSKDWLRFIRTHQAKSKIRNYFNKIK